MKYRLVETNVLGCTIRCVKKRVLFIFWVTVMEQKYNETTAKFFKRVYNSGIEKAELFKVSIP